MIGHKIVSIYWQKFMILSWLNGNIGENISSERKKISSSTNWVIIYTFYEISPTSRKHGFMAHKVGSTSCETCTNWLPTSRKGTTMSGKDLFMGCEIVRVNKQVLGPILHRRPYRGLIWPHKQPSRLLITLWVKSYLQVPALWLKTR